MTDLAALRRELEALLPGPLKRPREGLLFCRCAAREAPGLTALLAARGLAAQPAPQGLILHWTPRAGGWDASPPRRVGEPDAPVAFLEHLLRAHPSQADAAPMVERLMKAADEGDEALRRTCRELLPALALDLRRHTPLPGAAAPFLTWWLRRKEEAS